MTGRPCSVCVSPDKAEIERPEMRRLPSREIAARFGLSASAVTRHRLHSGVAPAESPVGSHLAEALAVIAAVRLLRDDTWNAQDGAEAGHLTTLAAAVDRDPTNISALRELRITLADYRAGFFNRPNPVEQRELAELLATMTGGPDDGAYTRVYEAALAAGASPEAAQVAARAAIAPPEPEQSWWEQMAALYPEKASEYRAAEEETRRHRDGARP